MLGIALAVVVANIVINLAINPSFSLRQALMLIALCVATTFVVHEAVTAVEAAIARKDKNKV
jgi:hypothetical protein